jgi:membrane glycosyltransferase
MTPTIRRQIFASLVVVTILGLLGMMAYSLSLGGIVAAEWVLLICFAITLPWTAIGFWNAVIGFILLRTKDNAAAHVYPASAEITGEEKITTSTAIAMCIRNEDAQQVSRNLNAMMARLVASGEGDKFHVYVLSDSYFPEVISEEEAIFAKLKNDWAGQVDVTYRRREDNPGFKAGNIRDFCERWGSNHDYMLTLDADSVMSASSVLRMVRIMQKNDNLGILQSLVVGLPSDSAFTRVFQFGMRMGMKSYTIGSAWWQADCGPYWGHNALIRIQPFIDHCHLPKMEGEGPLSGWILSHDQVEAVYMRRAGFECRVLAEEMGSYEENPPHILEFIRRDLRWCHGNMQYFKLLNEPGLLPTSRIQLVLAILMFIGSPAWMLFIIVGTSAFVYPQIGVQMQGVGPGYTLFAIIMGMIFAPKIASIVDVLMRRDLRKSFGGGISVIFGSLLEIIFSMMLAPIMAVANTIFLFKLFVLRKAKGWTTQSRSAESLPLGVTVKHLWPQVLFGIIGVAGVLSVGNLSALALLICLPVFIGPILAVPFGITSSHLFFGKLAAKFGFWQLPEEETPPVIIRALNLPAISIRAEHEQNSELHSPLTTQELLAIDANLDIVSTVSAKDMRIVA